MHNRFFKNDKEKEYYFKAVVKRMNIKYKEKLDEINKHELSLMEVLYDNFCDKSNVDKELMEKTLLGWIELIENPKLYKVLKDLTIEDQIFISYIVKECKTQKELAKKYNIAHQNISKKINKIFNKLRQLIE